MTTVDTGLALNSSISLAPENNIKNYFKYCTFGKIIGFTHAFRLHAAGNAAQYFPFLYTNNTATEQSKSN